MKAGRMLTIWFLVLASLVCGARVSEAAEMGTAFTYQGHLYDANYVANGLYDLQFKLYDGNDPCVGSQVGSDVNVPNMDVIDGYFTVALDFNDASAFNGDARWLEIGVRPGEMNDPNGYTPLSPLQEVTPAPYALHTRGFLVDAVLKNVFAGEDAGASNTTGYSNSAMGREALYSNTTGCWNSAMGEGALYTNTTGLWNSAMGHRALYSNTTGYSNSAMGYVALYSNTTGWYNSAMGEGALYTNTTGLRNSAMGAYALYSNTTGNYNSAIGQGALYYNTTGYDNSAMGYVALASNTTGYENSAMGSGALYSNTTGAANTAMGRSALCFNTTGIYNSAMGYHALYSNTTGGYNTAIGCEVLYSNTGGAFNSAMGEAALYSNTTGIYNSAVGTRALAYNTTGHSNSAVGYGALYSNTTGIDNSAVGYGALWSNTTGNYNSAMGTGALQSNTTGIYNTAIGRGANRSNQEGSRNTAIGYQAGGVHTYHNKSGNVFIGYKAGYDETDDNKLYIANGPNDANVLIYGDFSTGRVGLGTTSPGAYDAAADNLVVYDSGNSGITIASDVNSIGSIYFADGTSSSERYRGFVQYRHGVLGDRLRFGANGSEIMSLSNGRVGIGTNNPQGKLDVNGSIYQRGIVLHADYVFEAGYELESIDEHSDIMWANKHLPGIPAAKIDENGREVVEVGAHRKGIVEELEKAHIYIEQLHKRIQELKEQSGKMEARLAAMEGLVGRLSRRQEGGI